MDCALVASASEIACTLQCRAPLSFWQCYIPRLCVYVRVRVCVKACKMCVLCHLQDVVLCILPGGRANSLGLLAQSKADKRLGSQVRLELKLVPLCLFLATCCLHRGQLDLVRENGENGRWRKEEEGRGRGWREMKGSVGKCGEEIEERGKNIERGKNERGSEGLLEVYTD